MFTTCLFAHCLRFRSAKCYYRNKKLYLLLLVAVSLVRIKKRNEFLLCVQRLHATIPSGRCLKIRIQWTRISSKQHSRFRSVWIIVAAKPVVWPSMSTQPKNLQLAGHTFPSPT